MVILLQLTYKQNTQHLLPAITIGKIVIWLLTLFEIIMMQRTHGMANIPMFVQW